MGSSSKSPKPGKILHSVFYGVKNSPKDVSDVRQVREDYVQRTREELKAMTPAERAIVFAQRGEFRKILGIRNFKELENRSTDIEFASRLLDKMADHLATFVVPDQIKDPETRRLLAKESLSELSDDANNYMTAVLKELVPGGENDDLDVANGVITCSDPAKLLLIANDRKVTKELTPGISIEEKRKKLKVRSEALRKVYLMLLFAQAKKFKNQHSGDLAALNEDLEKDMYSKEMGLDEHRTRYLVSEHWVREPKKPGEIVDSDEQDNQCVGWQIFDSLEEADQNVRERKGHLANTVDVKGAEKVPMKKLVRIKTTMAMRRIDIGKNGKPNIIEARVHTRSKAKDDIVDKIIRKDRRLDSDPSAAVSDLNGVRFTAKDEQENRGIMEKYKTSVGKSRVIEVVEELDSVGKDGSLKCKKYDLKADGRPYEFQFFTYPQYADYEFSQPQSHDAYKIKRAFENGILEALFPREIYNCDLEKYKEVAIRKILADRSYRLGEVGVFQVASGPVAAPLIVPPVPNNELGPTVPPRAEESRAQSQENAI